MDDNDWLTAVVPRLNETGAFYVVDNAPSSVTRFVNCVCTNCTVNGPVHDCGDGNECYSSCSACRAQ